jgi:hypothetical protein
MGAGMGKRDETVRHRDLAAEAMVVDRRRLRRR